MNGRWNIFRGQRTNSQQNSRSSVADSNHDGRRSRRSAAPSRSERREASIEESLGYVAWPSSKLCLAGGVAIFHLASSRVVVCHHRRERHWFLPKGRRDPSEESRVGAEREGFEESGYRNRILPLPIPHTQPKPHNVSGEQSLNVLEPILTQHMPYRYAGDGGSYLLFWYIAETVPEEVEAEINSTMSSRATPDNPTPYVAPPPFPVDTSLRDRIELDKRKDEKGNTYLYKPMRHEGTGVDSDEVEYESYLLTIDEALERLRGTTMEYVVSAGKDAILKRLDDELAESLKAQTEALTLEQVTETRVERT